MNNFEIIGRVNFIDIKYLESGKVYTRVLISEKQKDDTFSTFPITFFNTKSENTAEKIAETCQKGDYIKAKGKMNVDKFTDKFGQNREQISLMGFEFNKVVWSDAEKKYIDFYKENCVENDRYSTVEKTVYQEEEKLIENMLGTKPQTVSQSMATMEY